MLMFMFSCWQPEWMWKWGWLATLRLEAAGLAASWGRGGGDDEDYHRDCVIREVMTSWHLDYKTALKEQNLQREEWVGQESWFLDDKIDDIDEKAGKADKDDKVVKNAKDDTDGKDDKVDKYDKYILTRELGPELYWNLSLIQRWHWWRIETLPRASEVVKVRILEPKGALVEDRSVI